MNDCLNTFGEMIHHSPYLGLDEEKELYDAFDQTKKVYKKEFGQSMKVEQQAAFCNVPPTK